MIFVKIQGFIRNPFAFYFLIQRGFSGPIQTLRLITEVMYGLVKDGNISALSLPCGSFNLLG